MHLTGSADNERLLLDYLDIKSLLNYACLSKSNYAFIQKYDIYANWMTYTKEIDSFTMKIGAPYGSYIKRSAFNYFSSKGFTKILDLIDKKSPYDSLAFDLACANGHINVLKWWINHTDKDFILIYTPYAINLACLNNHIDILKWWQLTDLKIKFYRNTIDYVCKDGYVQVLDWILEINQEFPYTDDALDLASSNGHIVILNWWRQNNHRQVGPDLYGNYCLIEILYFNAINFASQNGHVDILDFWFNWAEEPDTTLEYNANTLDMASANNHINILEWWKLSGLELKYTSKAIDLASANGHVNVLDWWLQSGLTLKFSAKAINLASANGHLSILDWWLESGITYIYGEPKYTEAAIDDASAYGKIDVLNWWLSNKTDGDYNCWSKPGVKLIYTHKSLQIASEKGLIDVLDWWLKSGLPLKYNTFVIQKKSRHVLKWWHDNITCPTGVCFRNLNKKDIFFITLHNALD